MVDDSCHWLKLSGFYRIFPKPTCPYHLVYLLFLCGIGSCWSSINVWKGEDPSGFVWSISFGPVPVSLSRMGFWDYVLTHVLGSCINAVSIQYKCNPIPSLFVLIVRANHDCVWWVKSVLGGSKNSLHCESPWNNRVKPTKIILPLYRPTAIHSSADP